MDDKRDEKEFSGDLAINDDDAEKVTGGLHSEHTSEHLSELTHRSKSHKGFLKKFFRT